MTGLLEVLETIPTKGLYLSDYAFAENEQTDFLKEMVEKYNMLSILLAIIRML